MRNLSPVELQKYLQDCQTAPLLLDVREEWEFEICHLEGSNLMPTGQIVKLASTLEPDRETVVICHHGIRSVQVCAYLEQLGFAQIINLSGGVAAWAREVDPTMPTY